MNKIEILVEFDYSKLLGRIVEKYGTRQAFARAYGISDGGLNMKLGNKRPFTQAEIYRCMDLLDIKNPSEYFFKLKC